MQSRYAIYYVPSPQSTLHTLGSSLLGRDIHTGILLPHTDLPLPTTIDWQAVTSVPRIYGIHATIKAPFVLNLPYTEKELIKAFEKFCSENEAVTLPRLFLSDERNFLALRPKIQTREQKIAASTLQRLADRVVKHFDVFRAPLSAEDIARRMRTALTKQQEENLNAWGYPYVFSEYHFHITLSNSLTGSEERERLIPPLQEYFTPVLKAPLTIDSLCLCRQELSILGGKNSGAFSSGVVLGSREENATKQRRDAFSRWRETRKGSNYKSNFTVLHQSFFTKSTVNNAKLRQHP